MEKNRRKKFTSLIVFSFFSKSISRCLQLLIFCVVLHWRRQTSFLTVLVLKILTRVFILLNRCGSRLTFSSSSSFFRSLLSSFFLNRRHSKRRDCSGTNLLSRFWLFAIVERVEWLSFKLLEESRVDGWRVSWYHRQIKDGHWFNLPREPLKCV